VSELDALKRQIDNARRAPGHIEPHERIDLWVCDACGFGFDAVHEDVSVGGEDGVYSCPCCFEAAIWPALPAIIAALEDRDRLRAAVQAYVTFRDCGDPDGDPSYWSSLNDLYDALRAVLEEKP
jgi:hypothetical protein